MALARSAGASSSRGGRGSSRRTCSTRGHSTSSRQGSGGIQVEGRRNKATGKGSAPHHEAPDVNDRRQAGRDSASLLHGDKTDDRPGSGEGPRPAQVNA